MNADKRSLSLLTTSNERHMAVPTIIHQLCAVTTRLLVMVIVTTYREQGCLQAVTEMIPYFFASSH